LKNNNAVVLFFLTFPQLSPIFLSSSTGSYGFTLPFEHFSYGN